MKINLVAVALMILMTQLTVAVIHLRLPVPKKNKHLCKMKITKKMAVNKTKIRKGEKENIKQIAVDQREGKAAEKHWASIHICFAK